MKKTIFKYGLTTSDKQVLRVPGLANRQGILYEPKEQILKLDVVNDQLYVWIMIDTELEYRDITILIKGTGHDCSDVSMDQYQGTYSLYRGTFVGHVFIK